MARDYNINISVGGGNARPYRSAGTVFKTRTTLNSRMSEDADAMSGTNLSKVLTVGLAFNSLQKGNEIMGAYTGNRLRQRKIDVGMTFAKYGIGLAVNPLAGGVYVASDLAYRSIMYNIQVQKKNREADYYHRLSGNTSRFRRRKGGEYV